MGKVDVHIKIDVNNFQEVVDMIAMLRKERDYYREVVKKYVPLFNLHDDVKSDYRPIDNRNI